MRIIRSPHDEVPDHIVLTDGLNATDAIKKIHNPDVNLIACFLEKETAYDQFVRDAVRFDLPLGYIVNHRADENKPAPSIDEQIKQVFGRVSTINAGLKGAPSIEKTLQQFTEVFCATSDANQVSLQQRGAIDTEILTMRPHTDRLSYLRGIIDLSSVGLIGFDQQGLSREDRVKIWKDCYYATDFDASRQAFNQLSSRMLRFEGPVAFIIKGNHAGKCDNPLLHATVPGFLLTEAEKKMTFRPCWRVDSYYR